MMDLGKVPYLFSHLIPMAPSEIVLDYFTAAIIDFRYLNVAAINY